MGKQEHRGVYERVPGSGIWYARFRVKGKLYREIAGTVTKAKELYKLRTGDALQGKLPPALRTTKAKAKAIMFDDIADDALAFLAKEKDRHPGDEDRIKLLAEIFGSIPVASIKPSDIEERLTAVATERKWKPATQNRHKAVLSLVFRLALKDGKVPSNPARLVRKLKENNRKLRFLSPAEETKLKAAVQPKHPARWAFLTLALHTGCRASELHRLCWTEVDRTSAVPLITLLDTKNGDPKHVPLNSAALDALSVLEAHDEGTGFVCPRQHYRVWFELALKSAGITKFRFHDLRHTFASRATMSGVDLITLAELMGHKSLEMTKRYSHLAPKHLADAVSKLVGFGSIPQSIHEVGNPS